MVSRRCIRWSWLCICVIICNQTDASNTTDRLQSPKTSTDSDKGFTNWKQPYHSADITDVISTGLTPQSSSITLETLSSTLLVQEYKSTLQPVSSQPSSFTVLSNDEQVLSSSLEVFNNDYSLASSLVVISSTDDTIVLSHSPDDISLSSTTSSFISLLSSTFEAINDATDFHFMDPITTSVPFANEDFDSSLPVNDIISPTATFILPLSSVVQDTNFEGGMTSEDDLQPSQFPGRADRISPHPVNIISPQTAESFDPTTNYSVAHHLNISKPEPSQSLNDDLSVSSSPKDHMAENTTETILELIDATTGNVSDNSLINATEKPTSDKVGTLLQLTTAQTLTTTNKLTTSSSFNKKYHAGNDNANSNYSDNNYRRIKQAMYFNNLTKLQPEPSITILNQSLTFHLTSSLTATTDTIQFTSQPHSTYYVTSHQYEDSFRSITPTSTFLVPSTPVLQSVTIDSSINKYNSTLLESNHERTTSSMMSTVNVLSGMMTPQLTTTSLISSSPFTPDTTTSSSQTQTSEGGYVLTVIFSVDPALFDEAWKATQTVYVESQSISPDINDLNVEEISEVESTSSLLEEYDADNRNTSEVDISSLLPTDMPFGDLALSEDPVPCSCKELEGDNCTCKEVSKNEIHRSKCNCDVMNLTTEKLNDCFCSTESLEVALQAVINNSILPRFKSGGYSLVPISFEVKLKPRKENDTETKEGPGGLWYLINQGNRTQNPPPFTCSCKIDIKPNGNPSTIQCNCDDITTTTSLPTTTPAPTTEPPCNCSMPVDLRPLDCECNDTEITTPTPRICEEIELATGVFLKYNCRYTHDAPTPLLPLPILERCYCERKWLIREYLYLLNCTCPWILNATLVLLSPSQQFFSFRTQATTPSTTMPSQMRLEPCNGNDVELTDGIFLGIKCSSKPTTSSTTTTISPAMFNQCVHQEIRVTDDVSLKIKTSCSILEKYFGIPTRKPAYTKPSCSCVPDDLVTGVAMKLSCSCFRDGILKNMTFIIIAPKHMKRSQRDHELSLPTDPAPTCTCEEIAIQSNMVLKVNCDCTEPSTSSPATATQTSPDEETPIRKCLCQYEVAPGFLVNIKNSSCDCDNKIVGRNAPTFVTPQPTVSTTPTSKLNTPKPTPGQASKSCACVDQILGQGKLLLVNCSCENTNQNVVVLTRPSRSYGKRETKAESEKTPKTGPNCECEEINIMPGVLLKVNCECLRNTESSSTSTTAAATLSEERTMLRPQNICSCDEFYPYPDMVLLYNCVCEVHLTKTSDDANDSPQQDALETNIPDPLMTEFETTTTGYQDMLEGHEGNCVCDEIGSAVGQVLQLNCTCRGNVASIFVVKDNNTVVKVKTTENSNVAENIEEKSFSQPNGEVQKESLTTSFPCHCNQSADEVQLSSAGSETSCSCNVEDKVGFAGHGNDVTLPAVTEVTSPLNKNCSCDSVMPDKIFRLVRRHVPKEVSVVLCSCNLTEVNDERDADASLTNVVVSSTEPLTTTSTTNTLTTTISTPVTTSSDLQTSTKNATDLPTSVTVPMEELYDKKFWIRTVVRLDSHNESIFNTSVLEERLANAYAEAFYLHHREHLQLNRRRRRKARGIVTVQVINIVATPDPKDERELIYVVKSDDQPILAKYAVQDTALLDDLTMSRFLNYSIILKAEEYLKEPAASSSAAEPSVTTGVVAETRATASPGLSNDAVVILAVCLTLLILLLLLFCCCFWKNKKKQGKSKYNRKQVFEETGGVITGPGDSKTTGPAPRPLPPSPRRPKRSPPQDKFSLEADSSSSSSPALPKSKRKHKSRKDTSTSSGTKKGKSKRKTTTRKSDLEASLDDSGLVIDSPDSHRSGKTLLSDEARPKKKKKEKQERIKPLDVLRNDNFDTLSVTNAYFDYINQPDVVAIGQPPSRRLKPGRLRPLKDDQYMQQLGLRQSLDYSPRPDVPNRARASNAATSSRQLLPGFSDLGQTSTSASGINEPHSHSTKQRLHPVPKPRARTKYEPGSSPPPLGQQVHGKPEMDEVEAMLASQVAKTCPAEHLIRNIRQELQKFKTNLGEVDATPS